MQLSLIILIGSSRSVSVSEFESSIEKSPPLFAMFILLRSLSSAELTKTTRKLNMGDAWELDLVPRAYSPFKMADRHEEKRLSLLNTSENHSWVQKSKNSVLLY